MTTGTVKWFSTQKGFGFIAPDGGGNDAFVHISAVERAGLADLHEGQKVAELVEVAERGAKDLQLADEDAAQVGRGLVASGGTAGDQPTAAHQRFHGR